MLNAKAIDTLTNEELDMLFTITGEKEIHVNQPVSMSLNEKGYEYIVDAIDQKVRWVGRGKELIEEHWIKCTSTILDELKANLDMDEVFKKSKEKTRMTPKMFATLIDELVTIGKIDSISKLFNLSKV